MTKLAELRSMIEEVDLELINLLKKRSEISQQIGLLKKAQGLPICDPEREQNHLQALKELARQRGLNPEKIAALFTLLFHQSKEEQILNS